MPIQRNTRGEIRIKDLRLRCVVGVHPKERRARRDVVVQVRMEADLAAAANSDDIRDTLNYEAVCERVAEAVEGSSFFLIERLAGRVAEVCLENPRVRAVEIEVEKPGALRRARCVSVVLRRRRA